MDHRAQAKKLLVSYLSFIYGAIGISMDRDNIVEWEGIVDDIMDGVKQELKDEGWFQRGEQE